MIKSITNFLIIFFIFQQLKSQISQIDQNGYNAFCDETLHTYSQTWHQSCVNNLPAEQMTTAAVDRLGHWGRGWRAGRVPGGHGLWADGESDRSAAPHLGAPLQARVGVHKGLEKNQAVDGSVHGVGSTFVTYQNWETVLQFQPSNILSIMIFA